MDPVKNENPNSAQSAQDILDVGVLAFSQKYQTDPLALKELFQHQSLPLENLEQHIMRGILKALQLKKPHPISGTPLSFKEIFPPTENLRIEQNRSQLYLSILAENIPPEIQEKAADLAEPNVKIQSEDINKIADQLGESLSADPALETLMAEVMNTLFPPEATLPSPSKPEPTPTPAAPTPAAPTPAAPTPSPTHPTRPTRPTALHPHARQVIEKWFRSQVGVEIEDLPLEKKFELQGLPSEDDLKKPQQNRLIKVAKITGIAASWALFPACALLIVGAILIHKLYIKKTRSPQAREAKFAKEYGELFHPEKEPWRKQIASEIMTAGVDLHAQLKNEGSPTQRLVILGSCNDAKKTWECEEKALSSLQSKGYQVVSLDSPKDLPASAIEEIKAFRDLTETTPPTQLLDSANKFLGEFANEEWALTLARASLANQLDMRVAFNGAPIEKQASLEEKYEKLAQSEALKSKETSRDIISNVHGGPLIAANLEMARRESVLEKTKDTAHNLLKYSEEKTVHICPGRNSFALQEAWASVTKKRPLALQIAAPLDRNPWNPWGIDNPGASLNSIALTSDTIMEKLGKGTIPVPVPTPDTPIKKTPRPQSREVV